ncbi:MAG: RpiB/LacA/LacB family sugar-phosphate isomerase [Thermoguttaceae bacterium]|nr:RpiB/LacA/LacB family sugar-phosphate isomerase [Thermoguttaceae bacterium]MBR5757588.1 RpiB/LacA/LacB family sugar-phosphate isomerase [Thermoguttaceae bacterium]
MKIVFAADPFALSLRKAIVEHLKSKGYEVVDYGASEENTEIPYFDSCVKACEALQRGEAERGILLCGTGMGMNQIANRFEGVRAAVVESVFAAKMCRAINDSNVLCMGAMIWGDWMACEAVDVFLNTKLGDGLEDLKEFLEEAAKKVAKINP